jgi:hypothetical protein
MLDRGTRVVANAIHVTGVATFADLPPAISIPSIYVTIGLGIALSAYGY